MAPISLAHGQSVLEVANNYFKSIHVGEKCVPGLQVLWLPWVGEVHVLG